VIILVTAPNLRVARRLARGAVEAQLAACVNVLPKLESHYRWLGKIESAAEILLIFKSVRRRIAALEKFVLANHPYKTPEFLVLPVAAGNARYLAWMCDSLA